MVVLTLVLCGEGTAHAGFGLTKLRAGSSGGQENYAYTAGDVIVPEGSTDSGKFRRLVVSDSAGAIRAASPCEVTPAGDSSIAGSYSVQAADPPSDGTAWRYELQQFTNAFCSGAAEKTAALHFSVARATAHSDSGLSNATTTFAPGGRAYVRISGIAKVKGSETVTSSTDWDVFWISPSGAVVCENRGGGDRPDSSAGGELPGPSGSFLQYQPNATDVGDQWNRESRYEVRPCPALSAAEQGLWRIRVEADGTHSVTLPAFTVSDAPPAPSITSKPTSPGRELNATWSFTGEAASSFECRLDGPGGAAISAWSSCGSPRTYDLSSEPDGTYSFRVRAVSATGTRGLETESQYVLERGAPDPPALTSVPVSPGTDPGPSWSFVGSPGETFECRLALAGTVVADWSACTSGISYDLSAASDGGYSFSVRAVSSTGVPGGSAEDEYLLDRIAPAAPAITSDPGATGVDRTPEWHFSAEAGADATCRLERVGIAVFDWSPCTSQAAFDLSGEPDGTYEFLVRAADDAGNLGAPATSTYVLDSSAPDAPTIDATPPSPSQDRLPTWQFTTAAGTSTECRLEHDGVEISAWAACAGSVDYDLADADDGIYAFSVRAISSAGVPGPAASDEYVLDSTAPGAPSITFSPGPVGANTAPTWWFAGEAGAGFECRLDAGATEVSAWSPCAESATFDLSSAADGGYTFAVRAVDAAGNVGASASDTYTLDATPPGAPAITSGPGPSGADQAPAWSFGGDPDTAFECRLERSGTDVVAWESCYTPASYDLSAEPDDDYTFSVRAVDAVGNTSTASTSDYALDATAPAAPTIDGEPGSPGSDDTPTWSFSAEPGTTLECRLAGVSDWTACSGSQTFDLSAEADGTFTFSVRATDAVGNVGPAADSAYTLDRSVPPAPTINSSPGPVGSDQKPRWAFSGAAGSSFECRAARGATVVADWAGCMSPHEVDLSATGDGTYTFAVRAVSAAGVTGPSASGDYALDTTAPAAPSITGTPPSPGLSRSPSFAFSAEAGARSECRLTRGGVDVAPWEDCAATRTYVLAGEPDGDYEFWVRAIDLAGNVGPAADATYTLDTVAPPAPSIDAAPTSPGSSPTPLWRFSSSEAGALLECRLDANGWQACTSPHAVDLSAAIDRPVSFAVRAVDAAGNASPATASGYELDRAGADVRFTSVPGPAGNDRAPAWSFESEPGAAFACSLAGPGASGAWSGCASPHNESLGADGLYFLDVRAADPVGNEGAPQRAAYELDTTPPAAPRLSGTPGPVGAGTRPEWGFSVEAGTTAECRITPGDDSASEWHPCGSPYKPRLGADRRYHFSVRARDGVGNAGPAAEDAYRLDTTPPDAPEIRSSPGASGSDRSPAWGFTGEDDASFECRLTRNGDAVSRAAACSSPRRYDLTNEPVGRFSFFVRAIDAAGNAGEWATSDYALVDPEPDAAPAAPPPAADPPAPSPESEPEARERPAPPAADDAAPSPSRAQPAGRPRLGPRGHESADPRQATEAPRAPAQPKTTKHEDKGWAPARALRKAVQAIVKHADKSVFPLSVILIVVGFLGLQNRIDRSDPKLALAPLVSEPDLPFLAPE